MEKQGSSQGSGPRRGLSRGTPSRPPSWPSNRILAQGWEGLEVIQAGLCSFHRLQAGVEGAREGLLSRRLQGRAEGRRMSQCPP